MLYAASEVFKRAIDAMIHYGADKYKSIGTVQKSV